MLPEWLEIRLKIEADKDNLSGANLCDAKLMGAKLENANLSEADLTGAYLIQANLKGADLTDADLTRAVLSEADLTGANLEGTEMEDAFLHGADLRQVSNLTCDQLELSFIDRETRFPDYIRVTWTSEETFEFHEA